MEADHYFKKKIPKTKKNEKFIFRTLKKIELPGYFKTMLPFIP